LREFTDQTIDVPRGVPGAPFREGESDSTDSRRGERRAAAQLRQDTAEEGIHI
jgi:hypothetical protein